jgi:gamma-carbonic anhydrase
LKGSAVVSEILDKARKSFPFPALSVFAKAVPLINAQERLMLIPFFESTPHLEGEVFIEDSARIIGDVRIGHQSSVWFNVVVLGDVNHIRIGERTNIQDGSVVHVSHKTHPTFLGNDVTVGHNVTLHGCTIGDRCLIGIGAIVLDGAVIGDDCLVAAGSLIAPGTRITPRASRSRQSRAGLKEP